jgi:hypothetical protein
MQIGVQAIQHATFDTTFVDPASVAIRTISGNDALLGERCPNRFPSVLIPNDFRWRVASRVL